MSPARAPVGDTSLNSLHEKIGEITGTLRELNHATANNSSKIDALALAIATQAELVRRVEVLDKGQAEHHLRLAVLEADKHRREGAIGLVAWISRNWPVTFLITMVLAVVAWANGRLHV
jgi:hypothetical protein